MVVACLLSLKKVIPMLALSPDNGYIGNRNVARANSLRKQDGSQLRAFSKQRFAILSCERG